jgi:Alginate export
MKMLLLVCLWTSLFQVDIGFPGNRHEDLTVPSGRVSSGTSEGPETFQRASYFEANDFAQPLVQGIGSSYGGSAQPATSATNSKPNTPNPPSPKPPTLEQKIGSAHKLLFFENDFKYLCDPKYQSWYLGDQLKQNSVFGNDTLDIGGQYRARFHDERNMRGLGVTGADDRFLLHRTRLYSDWKLTPGFRVYAEMIDAESNYENFAPRGIEVTRADMLNLFFDKQLIDNDRGTLTARIGRQELAFGAQRLVSVLDWGNTRRSFEGGLLKWSGELWDVDGFWTHPMRVNPSQFDSPDLDQEFMGVYSKYKGWKGEQLDFYGLRFLNGFGTNNFDSNTIGTRWQGDDDGNLWDHEIAYQFGNNTDGSSQSAAMVVAGVGRRISNDGVKPTLWTYYDWASGDQSTGAGNGFNHLFPLAHRYNGFMDLFGRRNLNDPNVLMTIQPSEKWQLLAWYHYFFLANSQDTPYNVSMTPFNPGNTPASRELGHEIDLLSTWKVNPRNELQLGYSHFFSERYYSNTIGVPHRGDANFVYVQYTLNF